MIKPFIDQSQDVHIGGVAGKLYRHINDNSVHLTLDEKKLLDKLSAEDSEGGDITSSIDDIYVQLGNKADKDEIPTKVSQLENDMNFISEIPDYYTTEEEVKLLIQAYVEEGDLEVDLDELKKQIEELTKLVNQYGLTIEDLRKIIDQNTQDIENIQNYIENELVQNVKNIVNEYITEEGIKFELEPATITRLGGIKVGSGLDITGDGVLSVVGSGQGGGGDIDTDYLNKHYIRKDIDDETTNHITIGDGLDVTGDERVTGNIDTNGIIKSDTVQSHDMTRGMLGNGYYLGVDGDNGNNSILEIDDLLVRNKAYFEELEIRKLSYVNGTIILSAAGGIIQSVEELEDGNWKCYLKSDDGTTATTNTFKINDLVRCQTFDIKPGVYENVTNRFYWRQVVDLGTDENKNWIVLSKFQKSSDTENDTSGIPAEGDTIVQYGNTLDESRQNIISISATDTNAPSITMYTHVYTFSLADATVSTVISPQEVKFRSDLFKLVSGNESYRIAIDRGEWEASTRYYYWDRVSYGGSLWLCIYQGADGCVGIEPGSENASSYWSLQVQKGDAGDPDSNPKIEFGEPIVTTAFDGSKYYPDLTNKSISFHAETYDGQYIQDSNIISFSANSNNANLEISRDDENHAVIINKCELAVGETATISVHVALQTGTGEGSTISITGKMTVICIEYPQTQHSLQAYLSPQTQRSEYRIAYDEDGKIENIFWPNDVGFRLYLYYGMKLLQYSDLGNRDSNSEDHPYVRVTYYKNSVAHELNGKAPGDGSGTMDVYTTSDMQQDSNVKISDDIKSPSYRGSGYYPATSYEIKFQITAGETIMYLTGTFIVDINGSSSVFENTTKELLSVKTKIDTVDDNVTTITSQISQTAEDITLLTKRVAANETSIASITEDADQIKLDVKAIKDDYVTESELNLKAGEINAKVTDNTEKIGELTLTSNSFETRIEDLEGDVKSLISQTPSGIDMAVVYAGLKEAGIDIAVDSSGETPTGTVNIYGDQVTIKNTQNGQNVLWVSDNQAYLGNTYIETGKISSWQISDGYLGNSNMDSGCAIYCQDRTNNMIFKFGSQDVSGTATYNISSWVENQCEDYRSDIVPNVGMWMEVRNPGSTDPTMPHHAIVTQFGDIVAYGSVQGVRTYGMKAVPSTTSIQPNQGLINIASASNWFIYNPDNNADRRIFMPRLADLYKYCCKPNDGTSITLELTVFNSPDSKNSVRLCGRNMIDLDRNDYPYIYSGGSQVDYYTLAKGKAVKIILMYAYYSEDGSLIPLTSGYFAIICE